MGAKRVGKAEPGDVYASPDGDDEDAMRPLVAELASCPVEDILGFEERLADYLYQLDGEDYAREIGVGAYGDAEQHFSIDRFLHARCCVVARGRNFYMQVRRQPSRMPKDSAFEPLLSAAPDAFQARTGEPWAHVSHRSYETFSNRAGWTAR